MTVSLISLLLVIPLITMALVLLLGKWANIRDGASLAGGLAMAAVGALLYAEFGHSPPNRIVLGSPIPGLELAFGLDALGMLFVLVASTLWPITTLYAIGYMRGHNEPRQTSFFAWFAFSITCTMAIALSANLLTLFVFYELLTLSTYPLVTHLRNDAAKQGGRIYLKVLLGSSVIFLLPAVIWTYTLAGTLEFVEGGILTDQASPAVLGVLLALFVFGVGKAAIMPIHKWLPAAMVAPTPVSALLHAVAVVKAGVFTILKVAVFIFGLDTLAETPAATWLCYLAAATILVASVIALREDNLKRRLAHSTISQLNYITLGALLASSTAITGSAMHIAMHAFAKITLFFCAGAILVIAHKSKVSELDGLGQSMPITMGAFFIASLGIIGVPPTGGTWLLLTGTFEAHQWVLMATLMLSSLLSIAYLLVIPVRAFLLTDGPGPDIYQPEPLSPMIISIVLTAAGTILLFVFPDFIYNLTSNIET